MFINEWVQKVHTTAKSKGWWETPREDDEICQLFVTEIAEASECARTGEPSIHFGELDSVNYAHAKLHTNKKVYRISDKGFDTPMKPEGEAIELVDLLIRLGDYVGSKEWNLGDALNALDPEIPVNPTFAQIVARIKPECKPGDFSERPLSNHFDLVRLICDASYHTGSPRGATKFAFVFLGVMCYMVYREFDVEAALEMKAAYNEKRPYRHGGKLA